MNCFENIHKKLFLLYLFIVNLTIHSNNNFLLKNKIQDFFKKIIPVICVTNCISYLAIKNKKKNLIVAVHENNKQLNIISMNFNNKNFTFNTTTETISLIQNNKNSNYNIFELKYSDKKNFESIKTIHNYFYGEQNIYEKIMFFIAKICAFFLVNDYQEDNLIQLQKEIFVHANDFLRKQVEALKKERQGVQNTPCQKCLNQEAQNKQLQNQLQQVLQQNKQEEEIIQQNKQQTEAIEKLKKEKEQIIQQQTIQVQQLKNKQNELEQQLQKKQNELQRNNQTLTEYVN